jgi:hypothetical protein
MFYLGKIDSIVEGFSSPYVYICGDYNANIGQHANSFGRELLQFCEDTGLILADKRINPDQDRFTYMSDAHCSCHWIDHIVCTVSAFNTIKAVTVDYSYISSDHLPLCMEMDMGRIVLDDQEAKKHVHRRRVKWDKLSGDDIQKYMSTSDKLLQRIHIDHSLMLCMDSQCSDESHKAAIKRFHGEIVDCLTEASEQLLETVKPRFTQVEGWNDVCK